MEAERTTDELAFDEAVGKAEGVRHGPGLVGRILQFLARATNQFRLARGRCHHNDSSFCNSRSMQTTTIIENPARVQR